jgi:hypothetical protein
VPATPIFVERVEAMEGLKVMPPQPLPFLGLARWMLKRLRPWRHDPHRQLLAYAESELDTVRRMRASRRAKAERERALKQERQRERAARGSARRHALERFRDAKRVRRARSDKGLDDPQP